MSPQLFTYVLLAATLLFGATSAVPVAPVCHYVTLTSMTTHDICRTMTLCSRVQPGEQVCVYFFLLEIITDQDVL